MLLIFLTPVFTRHLWQLKTVVFLHRCLICSVLLVLHFLVWTAVFPRYGQANREGPQTAKNIDCLSHLVCFNSTVNGRSNKKRKEEAYPWKAGASSGHITNLKQSILETFNIYEQDPVCLSMEEVTVHTGHKVLTEVDNNFLLIASDLQEIIDQQWPALKIYYE